MKKQLIAFIFAFLLCMLCISCGKENPPIKPSTPVEEYFQYHYLEDDVKSISTECQSLNNDFISRIGYSFQGVYNAPNGNGIQYFTKEGKLIEGMQLTSDLNLYAKWEIKTYTMLFISDGKTYKTDSVVYGSSLNIAEVPIKTGYTFAGWADKKGTLFTNEIGYYEYGKQTFSKESGYDFSNNSDSVTLYAKFSINTYQVTYDYLGKCQNQTIKVEYGSKLKLPDKIEYENFELIGWSYINSPQNPIFYNNESIEKEETLYAIWKEYRDIPIKSENIVLDSLRIYNDETRTLVDEIDLSLPEGWLIEGWYSSSSLSGSSKISSLTFSTREVFVKLLKYKFLGLEDLLNYCVKFEEGYKINISEDLNMQFLELFLNAKTYSKDKGEIKIYIPNEISDFRIVGEKGTNAYSQAFEFLPGPKKDFSLTIKDYFTKGKSGENTIIAPEDSKLTIITSGFEVLLKSSNMNHGICCFDLEIENNAENLLIYGGDGDPSRDAGNGIIADKIYIKGSGNTKIYGGHGGQGLAGNDAGGYGNSGEIGIKGGSGGTAIQFKEMLSVSSESNLYIYAGDGGNGGCGGCGSNGRNGIDASAASNPGEVGGSGGNGGAGGDTGYGIQMLSSTGEIYLAGSVEVFEGIGGSGGRGGDGGRGGNGGSRTGAGYGKPGGNGGSGGRGGDGGNGGKCLTSLVPAGSNFIVHSGKDGVSGAGGNGGNGGNGGSGNKNHMFGSHMYGYGGPGGKGGDGNPKGEDGNNG